jgi:hypothetical protein
MLAESGLNLLSAEDISDGAKKIVDAIQASGGAA